ncbi:neuropeptides capa receptor-like [Rhinoraja longicauda]
MSKCTSYNLTNCIRCFRYRFLYINVTKQSLIHRVPDNCAQSSKGYWISCLSLVVIIWADLGMNVTCHLSDNASFKMIHLLRIRKRNLTVHGHQQAFVHGPCDIINQAAKVGSAFGIILWTLGRDWIIDLNQHQLLGFVRIALPAVNSKHAFVLIFYYSPTGSPITLLRESTHDNRRTVFYFAMERNHPLPLEIRVLLALWDIQKFYYPLLAVVGIPINLLTIAILSRRKCGLSKCVTCYLVAMASADLLVIIIDLILRHIPIVFQFEFVLDIPLCNIHAALLYAATDCSVWFTIVFTIDRFVAICSQKLKSRYCTEKASKAILATVTILSLLKNVSWYFVYTGSYWLLNHPWFCLLRNNVQNSRAWGAIELLHFVLTPGVPFILILLLNALTVRHILAANRARRRLRNQNTAEPPKDTEMENRRKSIVLLFVISGNFIILWVIFMVFCILQRMSYLVYMSVSLPYFVREMGFMLQLLSCCTNTCIYAVTQTKFRIQFAQFVKYPFIVILKFVK